MGNEGKRKQGAGQEDKRNEGTKSNIDICLCWKNKRECPTGGIIEALSDAFSVLEK